MYMKYRIIKEPVSVSSYVVNSNIAFPSNSYLLICLVNYRRTHSASVIELLPGSCCFALDIFSRWLSSLLRLQRLSGFQLIYKEMQKEFQSVNAS